MSGTALNHPVPLEPCYAECMGAQSCTCTERAALRVAHWHVATGLAGYGPEGSDGYACFDSLSGALEYARDELSTFVDMAHEDAHACGADGRFEDAWREVLRVEDLENWRANLDPSRRNAPLYASDPAAYAAMQDEQAAQFPRDVSHNTRLYLWQCEDPSACEHCDDDGGC